MYRMIDYAKQRRIFRSHVERGGVKAPTDVSSVLANSPLIKAFKERKWVGVDAQDFYYYTETGHGDVITTDFRLFTMRAATWMSLLVYEFGGLEAIGETTCYDMSSADLQVDGPLVVCAGIKPISYLDFEVDDAPCENKSVKDDFIECAKSHGLDAMYEALVALDNELPEKIILCLRGV